jgi:C-terminal processing protease CtpA/Prc
VAKDIHLWLRLKDEAVPTYRRCVRWNVDLPLLPKVVPRWHQHNRVVMSGTFEGGIAYLCLREWPASEPRLLEPAYRVLRRAIAGGRSLIVDVRANGGGSEPLAALFAGRFICRPVCYARHMRRRHGRFIGPIERWLQPSRARARFGGRAVALIGAGTVSSCESFAMMMRQVPNCRLIGERTAGASGNPKPVDLGNGVCLFVPSWQDLELDGTCLEGRGIAPDIEVRSPCENEKASRASGSMGKGRRVFLSAPDTRYEWVDPVLTAAVECLRR